MFKTHAHKMFMPAEIINQICSNKPSAQKSLTGGESHLLGACLESHVGSVQGDIVGVDGCWRLLHVY